MKLQLYLKGLLVILFSAIIMSGCITQKRCNSKFPPQTITIVKDSIITKDSIVYKPVEVLVHIKGDTVTKHDTVYRDIKTGLINSKPVYAETEFAKAKAQVVNSKLNLELTQKDSTFKVKTDSLNKEIYHWKEKYNFIYKKEVDSIKYIPKIYKFSMWYMWITIILVILRLLWKYKKIFI